MSAFSKSVLLGDIVANHPATSRCRFGLKGQRLNWIKALGGDQVSVALMMPRYFFHVRDSDEFIDDTGTEFPGADEARAQAVVAAGEMLRDLGPRFWNSGGWQMHVVDENGAGVCSLTFSAASRAG